MKPLLLALMLLPSITAHASAPTCAQLVGSQPLVTQLATLRIEAEAKRAAGDVTLAKVLYSNYTRLFQEAREAGVDLSTLSRVSSQAHERAQADAQSRAAHEARALNAEGASLLHWTVRSEKTFDGDLQASVSISPEGDRVALARNRQGQNPFTVAVESLDPAAKQPLFIKSFNAFRGLRVDWSSRTLIVTEATRVRLESIDSGRELWSLPPTAFGIANNKIAYFDTQSAKFKLETIQPRAVLQTFDWPKDRRNGQISTLTLNPDGTYLTVHMGSGYAIYDTATGKELPTRINENAFKNGENFSPKFSNDASLLASYGQHTVELYRTSTQDLISTFKVPSNESIRTVAFSPDSQTLMVRTDTGHLRAYSGLDGSFIRDFYEAEGVTSFDFTRDSQSLVVLRTAAGSPSKVQVYARPVMAELAP